jgi:hypothetical protein
MPQQQTKKNKLSMYAKPSKSPTPHKILPSLDYTIGRVFLLHYNLPVAMAKSLYIGLAGNHKIDLSYRSNLIDNDNRSGIVNTG